MTSAINLSTKLSENLSDKFSFVFYESNSRFVLRKTDGMRIA